MLAGVPCFRCPCPVALAGASTQLPAERGAGAARAETSGPGGGPLQLHVTAGRFLSPCLAFLLGGRSEVLWINRRACRSPLSVLQGPETAFCSLEGQL